MRSVEQVELQESGLPFRLFCSEERGDILLDLFLVPFAEVEEL